MEKKEFSKLNILKKLLSILPKLLYDILIIFCVILIVVVVWQRITDSNRSIYGYRLFRIVSGSMVPEFNIDEVVVCKEVTANTLKIGDVVVYRGRVGELNNKLVMHEIINITNKNGELIFSVKGIQNLLGDPNVSPSQILGKVTFKSSLLTYIYALATHTSSAFIIVMILVINVFIAFLPTKKEAKKILERRNKKNLKENKKEENKELNVERKTDEIFVENIKDDFSEKIEENNIEQNEEKISKNEKIEEEKFSETDKNKSEKEEVEENSIETSKEKELDETEILKEQNRKLQEENKKLKAKVRKIKEENKKDKK